MIRLGLCGLVGMSPFGASQSTTHAHFARFRCGRPSRRRLSVSSTWRESPSGFFIQPSTGPSTNS